MQIITWFNNMQNFLNSLPHFVCLVVHRQLLASQKMFFHGRAAVQRQPF